MAEEYDPFTPCDAAKAQVNDSPGRLPDEIADPCEGVVMTPVAVMGVFVSVLKQHFGAEERLAMDNSKFLWKEELSDTELVITTSKPWNDDKIQDKPTIYVDHQDVVTRQHPSLGFRGASIVSFDNVTGERTHAAESGAVVAIRCFARSVLEAWSLGYEVKTLFDTVGPEIGKRYALGKVIVTAVRKPVTVERYNNYEASSVLVQYTVMNAWKVMPENLPIQKISFEPPVK